MKKISTSTPVIRTGAYPHMRIAVRGCPASSSHHQPSNALSIFHFLTLGAYPSAKVHQKGRRIGLPSYKISARSRKRSTKYALPKFFIALIRTPEISLTKNLADRHVTNKQTVNDISPACLSACGDKNVCETAQMAVLQLLWQNFKWLHQNAIHCKIKRLRSSVR